MPQKTVFIDGGEGTTGLRIRERLSLRSELRLLVLEEERRKDPAARAGAMASADLTILCLPDDAARESVALAGADVKICDASTAHRTLPNWVYGFPELGMRGQVQAASRVAVPGCHATGFLALVAPLVRQGALPADYPFFCQSLTGYSGGGKKMIAAYESPEKPYSYNAPRLYALGMGHKHLPEMQAVAGLLAPPLFYPVVDDYYSGMLVSTAIPASCFAAGQQNAQAIASLYTAYYESEPLITVHPAGQVPKDGTLSAGELAGRDSLEIFVLGSEAHLLLAARFDNLGKGASGAAIQCMNLMLGLAETEGLVL